MERLRRNVRKSRRTILRTFRKSHPYVIPVIGVTLFTLLSSVVLIASNGQVAGASDSRLVNVMVDGQKQLIPTRAATVGDLLNSMSVELAPEDVVEPAKETQIIEQNMQITVKRAQPVIIMDGTRRITIMSALEDPRKIVEQSNLVLYPEDIVASDTVDHPLIDGLASKKFMITRASLITLNLYGENTQVRTQAKTVAQLMTERNINPEANDMIQPSREARITPNVTISISRYGKQIVNEDKSIDPPVEYVDDANASAGTTTVKEAGAAGKKVITYEVETKDGKEISRKVIQETVVQEPVKKVIARGTRPLFDDYNADGIPARVFCGSPAQRNWKNINVTNAAIGRTLAAEKGWTGSEFTALLELWACESSWTTTAGNPYSGAYGIPQSLPASKMSTAGGDYLTNPKTQITWGLNYIAKGYGSPSAALAKHYRSNWY